MSLWIGKSSNEVNLIANTLDRSDVIDIIKGYFQPSIGELKYVAIKNYNNHINSDGEPEEGFNGWIIPDGITSLKISCFQEAASFFNISNNETTFTIPTIDQFIKAYADNNRSYEIKDCESYIASHTHQIDSEIKFKKGGTLTNFFRVYSDSTNGVKSITGPDGRVYPELHNGSNNGVVRSADLVLPLSANFSLIQTEEVETPYRDLNCYPEHINLNILMYIGGI